MILPRLRLKKHEERRLQQGHLWIFSNEVEVSRTPLTQFTPGEPVVIENYQQKPLGIGYVNPNSLIAARFLTPDIQTTIDHRFLAARFKAAFSLREKLFTKPYYRLIYGESDYLPGLIIDRFGDHLVVQTNTAGMECLKDAIIQALEEVLHPLSIVFKNQSSLRLLEGLTQYTEIVKGNANDWIEIEENGSRFWVDLLHGQKTGWFYDQRQNRAMLMPWVKDRRVLDLFCYSGAWGILAAGQGAHSVELVDSSESALQLATENARLNGVSHKIRTMREDIFEFLKNSAEKYDMIILDPPALIKRKKEIPQGIEAYRRLNRLALQRLAPQGLLISASCSYHLNWEQLHQLLGNIGREQHRSLVFCAQGGQAIDHPIHPAIMETAYLKAFFCYSHQ
jgi:23S rRNA (cytosine1962-C5)-methyltransferase